MVKIIVSKRDDADIATTQTFYQEEFELPLGLLCDHSKYFEAAFQRDFAEASSGKLEVDDVHVLIFRIFVGWIYFRTIFVDTKECVTVIFSTEEAESAVTRHCVNRGNDMSLQEKGKVDQEQDSLPFGGIAAARLVHGREHNPLEWPLAMLFDLYIFADKYDVGDMRMHVFDLVQYRVLMDHGFVEDSRPKRPLLKYLFTHMPPDAKIIHMLIDVFYRCIPPRRAKLRLAYHADLPPQILARILWQSLRYLEAKECKTCTRGQVHTKDRSHSVIDLLSPIEAMEVDPCLYHEHGDDDKQEAQSCRERWARRLQALRKAHLEGDEDQ